ncbi:MAG: response regulator transcription factor [Flavobacteriales bacterium]|nr:response regulator transcription factor [Flavobacteriales bacterium]MCB9174521.1 response regulator transcription factor [Flavobacteriales bacterium]
MLKVYLADDHNIVAQGLASLIRQISTVDELKVFQNGKNLFDACLHEQPDVVFLDIEMPIWDGRKTLVELRNKFPIIRCNMLSMNNEKAIIDDCISKGALGYLSKDCTIDELKEAILNTSEVYFSKDVLKHLSGYGKTREDQKFLLNEPLTEREVEVLTLLCDGLSPKEIANKIHLSPRTVETHKTAIMQKFEVNSVGKLISVAIKNKVISI